MTAPWKFLPCETCCESLTCAGHLCLWTDATAVTVTQGTLVSGTFTSLYSHSAGYIQVQPGGAGLDCYVSFQLGTSYAPVGVRAAGRYQAASGKSIDVALWNWTTSVWDSAGTWEHRTTDYTEWEFPEYALSAENVSPSGEVRVRWQTNDTNTGYRLYLDVARACHDREPFDQYEVTIDYPECVGLEGNFVLDPADYQFVYHYDPPVPCGFHTAGSIELQFYYISWLEPYDINGMEAQCRVRATAETGGYVLLAWFGSVYPPTDCDLDELTLPSLWFDNISWPPTAGRPVVSAVH